MTHCIIHACGHEQAHYIPGSATQKQRKMRWLMTTRCRACFVADKKAEDARAAASDAATIAHLDLVALVGSERQTGWAAAIRAKRLAGVERGTAGADLYRACARISDAKWWIDHRDLGDADLLAEALAATKEATIRHAA